MRRTRISKQPFLPTVSWLLALVLSYLFLSPIASFATDDSICAKVNLDVKQGMTLERQAFDAHMRINNRLINITLENVDIDVTFSDEDGNTVRASYDPDDKEALFFIHLDSLKNIDNVDGSGVIQPSTSADIHWLIIPAPGASNGLETGTLYYVGATLTYTIGGKEQVTRVYPDFILVKPLPELTLDYFLPKDVHGDDAFNSEIEPAVPFSLGVRVKNNGASVAQNMKIDSAQLKIIDNQQGLLIGFVIEGCEVNGEMKSNNFLVNFGDIQPNESAVARWVMTCSLSGEFEEFNADYSHADELGGELTSLLESVNTHFLVRDVLVDLPGRDAIRDFLGKDGTEYRVYESDNGVSEVVDQSGSASLELIGQFDTEFHYSLAAPVTAGFMYVHLPDPQSGQKVVKEVVRSDGKYIKPENVWLSKTRNEDHTWKHFINLFDVNTTNLYTVILDDGPHAPELHPIPNPSRREGEQLSFIVEASDPDGTVPLLCVEGNPGLPRGASFVDRGDRTGTFDWTPAVGQAGRYTMTFKASDGVLEDSQLVVLTIYASENMDTDGDGIRDGWELEYFSTLGRDGTGDFDGDGISDLDEYLADTNPVSPINAPSVPVIFWPEDGTEVTMLSPALTIENSTDPDGDPLTYEFQLYADEAMASLVAGEASIPEGQETTSWTVSETLSDNTWYFWRVRATDGIAVTKWAYGSFFVNTENDPPGSFAISSPQDDTEVDTLRPMLEVTNSVDADHDRLTYTFEVYTDSSMSTLLSSVADIEAGEDGTTWWQVPSALTENTWYFWRAITTDEHGAQTATPLASFFVNTFNHAPVMTDIVLPASGSEVDMQALDLVVTNASDQDADGLTYVFELDRVNTFDSPAKVTSGEIPEGTDTTSWHVSDLADNSFYYWRAKASDGFAESDWVYGSFFVNTANDNPATPTVRNPGHMAWVDTLMSTLEVNRSPDADYDSVIYEFELYADDSLSNSNRIQGTSDIGAWVVPSPVDNRNWYYWRARAKDEHDAVSAWTEPASFFVIAKEARLDLDAGWSMVSLPIDPMDKRLQAVFPNAVVVYRYEKGTGYLRVLNNEELKVGKGYWILLDEATSYTITGQPIELYTLRPDEDGWAMIGGCTDPANVFPDGCEIGVIYRYVQGTGYQRVLASEPLEPGKGYWILLTNVTDQATISVIAKEARLDLDAGWSLVSLPVDPTDKRLTAVFPNAVVVYRYEKGTGYVRVKADEELTVGKGYWILLDEAISYTIPGQPIESYILRPDEDGWAMIGGCTDPAKVFPSGCDIGVIYGYTQGIGYQRVTGHLERGKGYWILLNNVAGGATISVETVD